jgi:hypothetical protein
VDHDAHRTTAPTQLAADDDAVAAAGARLDLASALPVGPTHAGQGAAEVGAAVVAWARQHRRLDPAGWTRAPALEGTRRAVHPAGYAIGAWQSTLGWTARLYATGPAS